MNAETPSVFISYATPDKTTALMVCEALEQQSIRCWIAPRDVPSGADAFHSIPLGIQNVRVLVLILSGKTSDSKYVTREINLALKFQKHIIPFRVEEVEPDGAMSFMLTGVQWLDAFAPPIQRHIASLVERIAAILNVQTTTPPTPSRTDSTRTQSQPHRRFPIAWTAAIATVVIAAAAGFYFLRPHTPAPPPPQITAPPGTTPSSTGAVAPASSTHISAPPAPKAAANGNPSTPSQPATIPHTTTPDTPEQLRARAFVLTGQQRLKDGNYTSAAANFDQALNLDPDNKAAKAGLAAANKALGENP